LPIRPRVKARLKTNARSASGRAEHQPRYASGTTRKGAVGSAHRRSPQLVQRRKSGSCPRASAHNCGAIRCFLLTRTVVLLPEFLPTEWLHLRSDILINCDDLMDICSGEHARFFEPMLCLAVPRRVLGRCWCRRRAMLPEDLLTRAGSEMDVSERESFPVDRA
jgi:hypothetical protein